MYSQAKESILTHPPDLISRSHKQYNVLLSVLYKMRYCGLHTTLYCVTWVNRQTGEIIEDLSPGQSKGQL